MSSQYHGPHKVVTVGVVSTVFRQRYPIEAICHMVRVLIASRTSGSLNSTNIFSFSASVIIFALHKSFNHASIPGSHFFSEFLLNTHSIFSQRLERKVNCCLSSFVVSSSNISDHSIFVCFEILSIPSVGLSHTLSSVSVSL
jgi:hypothetical protein